MHTKETAEELLRELPSVLGAFVREDINGHPREVHLLVSPGPSVKLLAQDVRDLLEERLGIPIDQRVISIAQLAEDVFEDDDDALEPVPETAPAERRIKFVDVISQVRDQRVRVRTRLSSGEAVFEGEDVQMDLGTGRFRAASIATLRAAARACPQDVRLELDSASIVKAFDREYVLISVLAGSHTIGRKPLILTGAQPVSDDGETAAALATLKAINRVLAKILV